MGKKGVIMDNGKFAQSSMALYWKSNRDKAKHPKQKYQEQDDKQISDKSVMSNFQKWKLHKEKVITKSYTNSTKQTINNQKHSPKKKDEEDFFDHLIENKKPKIVTIPGFKSRDQLEKKLQIQKPKQADQSTNLLKLPSHMQALTQDQIVLMLRQRKSKQQILKRSKAHHQQLNQFNHTDGNDMLLGQEYIDLNKKKAKDQNQTILQQKPVQKIILPQPSYFKSEILNKIEQEGVQKVLTAVQQKIQIQNSVSDQKQKQQNSQMVKAENLEEKTVQIKPKPSSIPPKFLPRVLKK